jgi:aryl-alcohol dehydrogenase-like predicted oxidoreductase
MKYRTFPNSNVTVSELGFGLWTLSTGWWGDVDETKAIALLHQACDLGVTFFDAADTYGNGKSEELLANAFRDRRDKVVYATKVGYNIYDPAIRPSAGRGQAELPQNWDPKYIRFAVEKCLERLQTDVIDFLQLHNCKMDCVRADGLYEELGRLKDQGKIRLWGGAFGPAIGWLYESIDLMELRKPDGVQMIWNLLEQHPGTRMVEAGKPLGVGFVTRVTHSSGLLEGKYTEDTVFPEGDHRRHRPRSWLVNGLKKVEKLAFLTDGTGRTLGQAALKWLLAEPAVVSNLPNIYGAEQLEEFAAASDVPDLTANELKRVQELYQSNFGIDEAPMQYKGTMTEAQYSASS